MRSALSKPSIPRPARRAGAVLLGAVALTACLPAAQGVAKAPPLPCAGASDRTYLASSLAVARQISAGESASAEVTRAVATIEADQVLAQAVAGDDLPVVQSEVHALVFNHEHIVRLRVLRDGRVLDDLGGPLVLAPVSGTLHLDGRAVGTFVMSVQDDAGYQKLLARLVGAGSVMRYQGETVLSTVDVGSEPLPARGSVVIAGVSYLVASFAVNRFPTGRLSVSLLVPTPAVALMAESCEEVSAGVLAAVAQRVYNEAITSPWWVGGPLTALARASSLATDLAAGDDAAVSQIVSGLVAAGGFEALDVIAAGRVVASAGSQAALIAPVTRPLIDGSGRQVGDAVFAVETGQGYAALAQSFIGAAVLVRAGAEQLAGSFAGPAVLPRSGTVSYLGVRYAVASFAAVQFPSVAARVYVLARL